MNAPVGINEQARRQFELSWQRGEPANIADFLPAATDASYAATLEELIHIDIEFRGSRQQKDPHGPHLLLSLSEYIEQFPQLSDPAIIRRLISQEIHVRQACSLAVDQQQYVRDFGQVVAQTADVDALLADTKAAFRSTVFKSPDTHEAQTFVPATTDPMKTAMTVLPGIDRTTTMTSVPEQIGNYRLRRQLGAGGMGCVYEAEELGSGQRVALKVILPDLGTSDEAMDRFRQEGQLASGISHPNCVFVLEADQEGDYPYIAMELVKGTDLDEHVRENGPLEILDALRKTIDLIEGLEEAHRLGVIHRDVKPSNCFLTQDGRVKIGDFGLSRTLAEDVQLTMTGSFIGTPLYASPEQIRGEELDDRTDVYSVASTLYFLLTGKAPFHSDNAVSAMARIVADPAPSIREQRPELHRAIASVIHRGLETDRKKRWRSMSDFRDALLQFLPEKRTPVGEGLRFCAYWIDLITLLILQSLFRSLLWLVPIPGFKELAPKLSFLIFYFLYFVSLETLHGCTIGKRLFGFRIRRVGGGAMGLLPVLARTTFLWFFVWGIALSYLTQFLPASYWAFEILPDIPLVALLGSFFIFVPILNMSASNGYRGLHDRVSGAIVVRKPSQKTRARRIVAVEDTSTVLPPISTYNVVLPKQLGAYRIERPIRLTQTEIILDAEDDRVQRNVWIQLRDVKTAASSTARRDIDRPHRLRWLASGDHEQRPWDAYLAAEGMSLAGYLKTHGTLDWLATREILESLAAELEIASDEQSLATHLSPHHIWIRPDGGIVLMDFTIDRNETILTNETQTADQKGITLLIATAIYCLEGVCPTAEDLQARDSIETVVTAPISYRFRKLLARCVEPGPPLEEVKQFRAELEATRDLKLDIPKVKTARRIKHLMGQSVLLFPPVCLELGIFREGIGIKESNPWNQAPAPTFLWHLTLISIIPFIILAWTFAMRGGYIYRSAGIMIAKTNGARASRLRCTFRALLAWAPFVILMVCFKLMHPNPMKNNDMDWLLMTWLTLLGSYYLLALVFPRRGLHDLIAGTTLIPR